MFKLSFHHTILRYYLMMAVSIVAVYTHQSWLILLAFAVAVSAVLGMRIGPSEEKRKPKVMPMGEVKPRERRKAG